MKSAHTNNAKNVAQAEKQKSLALIFPAQKPNYDTVAMTHPP